jgi:glycerol-3-phosphate dehydrogenase
MRIAVVGGGINGVSCAWQLAEAGHSVVLFERGEIMQATSRASSKLLHGGLRYLGELQFGLVRESLRERDAWLRRVPEIAHLLSIVIPVYEHSRRGRLTLGIGLFLYWLLAPTSPHARFHWRSRDALLRRDPDGLDPAGLRGGYEFFDGQSDDYRLGLWVLERARAAGVVVREHTEVLAVSQDGRVRTAGADQRFDRVVNVAGPWAQALSAASGVRLPYALDLVRGSHLILDRECRQAYLFEVAGEERVVFVLPWHGRTLVGTTEVRQTLDQPISCSPAEQAYLLDAYNRHMRTHVSDQDVVETFAGVRPLIKSASNPTRASREYAICRTGSLITVLGGKWTTAVALARHVVRKIA